MCVWLMGKYDCMVGMQQDLVARLLERKPARRLGMLNGRANDIKKHKWFEGLDWEALEARKVAPLRKPKEDSAKRLKELTVRLPPAFLLLRTQCFRAPSSAYLMMSYNLQLMCRTVLQLERLFCCV